MKPHLCLFLACAGLLAAQDKGSVAPPENIQCFIETFTLAKADCASLLDAPHGRERLHERVLAAVKAGSARLDGCHLLLARSGTRCRVESVDELIYATHWSEADSAGFQYPEAFEIQPLGDSFETEAVLQDQKRVLHLNQSFSRNHFHGLHLCKADSTLAGVPVPKFFQQNGQSHCQVMPDIPTLLSTLGDAQAGDITLVFATPRLQALAAPKTPAPQGTGTLRMTARVISLDRMKGWALLKKHAGDGAACLTEIKPLLAAKEAVLEHVSTTCTLPGQHAAYESGQIHTYLGEHDLNAAKRSEPPGQAAPAARAPMDLESRTLGFRIDHEPALTEEPGFVHMAVTASCVRMTGNLKDKNWSARYPEQPVFSNQSLSTEYAQVLGGITLLGTMNPPGDTGANEHKDDGRMWLFFMDVNLE